MNRKGFTLIELLVVIAIIAVLSIIIIPSVININGNINERLLSEKIENIESSAILYATNNEELFNGTDVVYLFVYELVDANYMTVDVAAGSENCVSDSSKPNRGCVINPTNKESINNNYVILRKEGVGITATYVDTGNDVSETDNTKSMTLVEAVCAGFANGTFRGQTYVDGKVQECTCDKTVGPTKLVKKGTNLSVVACLISGENVNNYLKYGDTKANWRVLGVYDLDGIITAKMITSDPV